MSNLIEQLKRHEGLRLKPYRDTVGKLTIGYGRNLDDVGISKAEAERMLLHDISNTEDELLQFEWYSNLDPCRQDIIVNMCFNMGLPTLLKFKNMIAAIESGDYDKAADEMLDSKWARQVGSRANELAEQMREVTSCGQQ